MKKQKLIAVLLASSAHLFGTDVSDKSINIILAAKNFQEALIDTVNRMSPFSSSNPINEYLREIYSELDNVMTKAARNDIAGAEQIIDETYQKNVSLMGISVGGRMMEGWFADLKEDKTFK